jgi:hypothetical protein
MSFIKLPINIAQAQGGYSLKLTLGSENKEVLVVLDTGSSTLAIKKDSYQPETDQHLTATTYAQDVTYGKGGWAGPVIHTEIGLTHIVDDEHHDLNLKQAPMAVMFDEPKDNFNSVDGIFGLAYHHLNRGYDLKSHLIEKKIEPQSTYPWTFEIEDTATGISQFKSFLKSFPEQDITPFFTELEEKGVIANKFGLLTHRAVSHANKSSDLQQQIQDPLNQGYFIIGDAHHSDHDDHHHGDWQTAAVLHDAYYNTQLLSVRVEGFDTFQAPELEQKHLKTAFTNCIVDSGSSFIMLQSDIYHYVMNCFKSINPEFLSCIEDFNACFAKQKPYKPESFDIKNWPIIHFELQGTGKDPIQLSIDVNNYWQNNATSPDQLFFAILNQIPNWPNQSILGLPLMNNYFCVFDRSDGELGSIHFAKKKDVS